MPTLETVSTEALVQRGITLFRKCFPNSGEPTVASAAPGRVNLIGEHTDYNEGFVLPMALEDRETVFVGTSFLDSGFGSLPRARLVSELCPDQPVEFALRNISPGEAYAGPAWANYIRGMVAQFLERSVRVPSFDAVVVSEVPLGGGVSSSAALEMACAVFLQEITGVSLDPVERARMGQRVEHLYAGVPSGIMDQLISAAGVAGSALLIDCRTLETRAIPLDDPEMVIVVVNSNVKHSLADGEYGRRRRTCEQAAAALNVASLRDATREQLEASRTRGILGPPEEKVYERALHVIEENNRVLHAVSALQERDYVRFGKLMYESHESLRTNYQVSCDEIDALVEIARQVPGVYGSRMTGGGFGGCTVTLVRADAVAMLLERIEALYPKRTGKHPTSFISKPGPGSRPLAIEHS
ncbi:galactokinase [Cyanidioschyzon merolae strain 10D]|jgi:galactokinase|uniref:Galactokinase n=1 Tax=Cyanidioschyzon merolae (strain NIES-3377 / 10D) TaxID=280699 RepID=M1VJ79_CYAM1|nr:galactokinase [Cyanidioschyzon merolae strain 10D]BAM81298.1 galactokinase [Cyanidioschyzon merolae strain 10D]|eukprot:XP_005537334.1 galactokinase [Cyanidioschyzon merolae strain 10D]